MVVRYRARTVGQVSRPLESKVQEEVIAWAKLQFPACVSDALFANMNGTMIAGNAAQRARYINAMKRRGMRPGVSDLTIAIPRGRYHGMYLELKRDSKSPVSTEQEKFLADMRRNGYHAEVAKGFNQAIEMIANYIGLGVFHWTANSQPFVK